MSEEVTEILEAYRQRRSEAQDFIYAVRRMRKFGAFGVVSKSARENPVLASIDMARFLISHLQLCSDTLFSEGTPQLELKEAVEQGHPIGEDANTLLKVLYTVSDLPLNRSEILEAAQ